VTFSNLFNAAPKPITVDDLEAAIASIKALKGTAPRGLEPSFRWRSGVVEDGAFYLRPSINDYPQRLSRSNYFFSVAYPPKSRRLSQCLCVTSLSSGVGLPQCWREQASEWNVNRCGAVEVEIGGRWHVYVPRGRSR